MNVSLTPELEELIRQKVDSGLYYSASEVVREALRLLKERDELQQKRSGELRGEIQKGLDCVARGDVVEGEAVFDEIRRKSVERRRKSA